MIRCCGASSKYRNGADAQFIEYSRLLFFAVIGRISVVEIGDAGVAKLVKRSRDGTDVSTFLRRTVADLVCGSNYWHGPSAQELFNPSEAKALVVQSNSTVGRFSREKQILFCSSNF